MSIENFTSQSQKNSVDELIANGAEKIKDQADETERLKVTEDQINDARKEMEEALEIMAIKKTPKLVVEKDIENKEEGFPIIELHENSPFFSAICKKGEEYSQRLNSQWKESPHQPLIFFADPLYKVAILIELLKDGKVNTYGVYKNLTEQGKVDVEVFKVACMVIKNYVENGGKGNIGGTGLDLG